MQTPAFRASDPGEARTLDPLIKSQLLYQLSYGVVEEGAKVKKKLTPIVKYSNVERVAQNLSA